MSSTLETNATRTESAYRKTLQDLNAAESTSAKANWAMNKHDQIY